MSDLTEKHSTMPDSPVAVMTPCRLTSLMTPPPTQGASRTNSFTPTLTNETSHSPTALNGVPLLPRSSVSWKGSLLHCSSLTNGISPEIGERVCILVLVLHRLLLCARMAKKNPAQYLIQIEQLYLNASTTSLVDCLELFLHENENGKRTKSKKITLTERICTQNIRACDHELLAQTICTVKKSPAYPTNPLAASPHFTSTSALPCPPLQGLFGLPSHKHLRDRNRSMELHGVPQEEMLGHRLTVKEWVENGSILTICIMDRLKK
ncbi:Protein CBFA2T1, partial [Galemys pyrenaicus]